MHAFDCLSNITYRLDPSTPEFNHFYYTAQLVMFGLSLIFITFIGAFFYAMYCYPPFHLNLQILMVNFFVSYGSLTIGRLIGLIAAYKCPSNRQCFVTEMLFTIDAYYSEWIKYISMIAFVIASYWVIGERTWATIYLKGYENRRSVKTIFAVIILQWALAAAIVYSFFMSYVPVIIPIIVIGTSCAFFLIVYRIMQKVNRRRYKHSKKYGNAYTLSERYQLAENIQTEPIVSTLLIISVIFESLHLISGAILHFGTDINTKLIGKLMFEILFTIDPVVFSIPLLLSVKKWRQIFRQYLVRNQICTKIVSEYDNSVVQEINDAKKEGDVYFNHLRQSWT